MKKMMALGCSVWVVGAVVAAETALGGFGGSLELLGSELLFQPCYRPNNWTSRFSLEDDFNAPAKDAHAYYFIPNADKPKDRVLGTAKFTPTSNGGVEAVWTLGKDGVSSSARATVCADFRLPQYEGAQFETDAGSLTLTESAAFGQVFDKDVRRLSVTDTAGALKVRLEFPEPVRVRLFKERDWGLVKFALHLSFRERPDGKGLALKAFAAERIAFREEGPQTIVAGKDWIPFQAAFDVEAGSALDFSGFRGTDAPAGKHGWVVAKDGHFEFEKRPGKPVRFYGINICSDANAPKPEDARAFAATLRKLGYNAIRFHHHETSLVKWDAAHGSTELNPAQMAKFDALVAACVENGIYLTTDLFVSRAPISYRSIGIDRDGNVQMNEFKYLVQVHEGAYSNYVAFARNFLNHVNPHTKRRYADEPALALLSLVNEGNMSGVQWAGRSFGLLKDYSKEAMAALEAKFARRMKTFLREEIGYKGLITNMNNYFWADDPPGEKVRAEEFDYSDDHFYVDHPRFIGQNWRLPSSCPNTNPLVGADKGTQRLASTRPWGLPFTITEYNFSGPGRFRGVGGILTGAMGARQDWGGLLRFAWTHGAYGLTHAKELGYFDMSGDPLGLAAERASICLFLRGDLAPADKSYVFLMPPEKVADTKKTPGLLAPYWAADWAAWNVRLGMCVADKAPTGVSTAAVYPEAPKADVLDALRREPTGGVQIDSAKGAFTLDTPRTAGGFAEGGVLTAGGLTVDLGTVPATIWASSLDGAPIAASRRLLLTHLTDVQNSGIRYADAGKRILLAWGKGPHLMRAGRAAVSLACTEGTWRVWALSPTGRRVREVAAAYQDGRLSFTADVAADPANASYLYELVAAERAVVDFSKPCGAIRPLNGLCNGPLLYGRGRSGQIVQWLKDLEIPYTRLHDVPLENPGMEVVDVSRIFPLFHADYDDPRNFNFAPTDDYVRNCLATGTELDFRFGETIEHTERRYRAVVPPDIDRWAEICVRIARHYRSHVKSWSIWEEPNNNLLLDGPNAYPEAFCRMYVTLAKRLKAEFPDMPVGGPALMGTKESEVRAFLAACREAGAPLDFFSYTNYDQWFVEFAASVQRVRALLDEYGFKETKIHLAEWHKGPESWNLSEIGHAAYFASLTGDAATAYAGQVLLGAQDLPVERLYYYCAFLNNWGLFGKGERRPVWYVFKAFSDLRKAGPRVAATAPKGWKMLAAAQGDKGRLLLAGRDAAARPLGVEVKGGLIPTAVRLIGAGKTDEPVIGWTFRKGVLTLPAVEAKGAVWVVDCSR